MNRNSNDTRNILKKCGLFQKKKSVASRKCDLASMIRNKTSEFLEGKKNVYQVASKPMNNLYKNESREQYNLKFSENISKMNTNEFKSTKLTAINKPIIKSEYTSQVRPRPVNSHIVSDRYTQYNVKKSTPTNNKRTAENGDNFGAPTAKRKFDSYAGGSVNLSTTSCNSSASSIRTPPVSIDDDDGSSDDEFIVDIAQYLKPKKVESVLPELSDDEFAIVTSNARGKVVERTALFRDDCSESDEEQVDKFATSTQRMDDLSDSDDEFVIPIRLQPTRS